ncbi:unnamed protein product [Pleuronectes platessa]|uniref:Uncharacterized protein n=1 Tax=Pleuronectes platessa TaxID=8262 RepID=A0A9N7YWE1_PLEPL|nr:unnamed protein product [Pleuronectes platessa]
MMMTMMMKVSLLLWVLGGAVMSLEESDDETKRDDEDHRDASGEIPVDLSLVPFSGNTSSSPSSSSTATTHPRYLVLVLLGLCMSAH